MGIFERIKTAIFGHAHADTAARTTNADRGGGAGNPAVRQPAAATPAAGTPAKTSTQPVDIEAVMKSYEARTTQKLNWRTSIVDLLKLLEIDSSLENRKELAKELGYEGSTTDTASMNLWLHSQVLRKLKESGGIIPASLTD
jgi:hypothetical protein